VGKTKQNPTPDMHNVRQPAAPKTVQKNEYHLRARLPSIKASVQCGKPHKSVL